jgi:hypothetical protein
MPRSLILATLVFLPLIGYEASVSSLFAQELQVRRWTHLPINHNFITGNYVSTEGEIAFDPVLRIEDANVDIDTWLVAYVRAFEMFDRTARIEVRQAWQEGTWKGLVDGTPTTVDRSGWSDTFLRFAINLLGAPPLEGKEYAEYRSAADDETIVGLALGIQIPTGQYLEDKLINLGSNRFTFRPQIGIQHRKENWTFEATGTVWLYTDNNAFFDGNKLEQKPFYTVDGSIEYRFDSGLWASASGGIGVGGQSTVNGVVKNDYKENYAWAVSMGFPLTRSMGIKATYLQTDHWSQVGSKSQSVSIGILTNW